MAGPSKRIRFTDKNFEETVMEWYNELNTDVSDIDNAPESEFVESEHDTNSEISESESDSDVDEHEAVSVTDAKKYVYSKNRFRWCTSEAYPSSRTRKHNIVVKVPTIRGKGRELGDAADPYSVWNLLFSNDILSEIIQWTNCKLSQMRAQYKNESSSSLAEVTIVELKAFLGLLIFTSIFNSNHEHIDCLFATDGSGRDIFRAVMSKKRFAILLSALRFDNSTTREDRKQLDPTAAISLIFNKFIENCQNIYGLGETVTIDEMLVSFRGKCRFKMYMPMKPCKYGIKIMCLTDSRTNYLYNAYIYCGKGSDGFGLSSDEQRLAKPTQAVVRLAKPLFGSNRNITADNWFSSIELVNVLRQNKLTFVGTLKKNKREIPVSFLPNKNREEGSSLYGFREEVTLISYVGKKGKATLLLSSMHFAKSTDPETQKPEIVSFYNRNKGGVDTLDEKCAKSSSSRRTRRWPLVIFFRMLDISIVNTYILHQSYKDNEMITDKSNFAKALANALVHEHMVARLNNSRIPREIRVNITRILGITEPTTERNSEAFVLVTRKACSLCSRAKHRMTKYLCIRCRKPICLQCSKPMCNVCIGKKDF